MGNLPHFFLVALLVVVRLGAGLPGLAVAFAFAAVFACAAFLTAGSGFLTFPLAGGAGREAAGRGLGAFAVSTGTGEGSAGSADATPTVLDNVRWHVSQVTIERTSVPSWWSSRRKFRGLPQNEQ